MDYKDVTKAILAKADIVEIISSCVQLKKAGREYQACCPFHNEKTPSFTISPQKQFFYCFGCQAKGDAIGFTMQYHRLTFKEAVIKLAKLYQIPLPSNQSTHENIDRSLYKQMREITLLCKRDLHNDTNSNRYLQKRGISEQTINQFHLGFTGPLYQDFIQKKMKTDLDTLKKLGLVSINDHGNHRAKFYKRLLFPIQDTTGKVIGFGGRVLDDHRKPKYLNSPETILFKKRHILYGLWKFKKTKENHVYIVEGYMDVVSLSSQGIDNAVACLGTAFSDSHWLVLRRFAQRATFCFDGDNAGKNAAWQTLLRILPEIQPQTNAYFMFVPDTHDPDTFTRTFGKKAFFELSKKAITWDQYLILHLKKTHDITTINGKASFINEVTKHAESIKDPSIKKALLEEINSQYKKQPTNKRANNPTATSKNRAQALTNIIISILSKKDQKEWHFKHTLDFLNLYDEQQSIIYQWLNQCENTPSISGQGLLSSLKDQATYTTCTDIIHQTEPSTFNTSILTNNLYKLAIANIDQKIQVLLKPDNNEQLTPYDKKLIQALIHEKKELQHKKLLSSTTESI